MRPELVARCNREPAAGAVAAAVWVGMTPPSQVVVAATLPAGCRPRAPRMSSAKPSAALPTGPRTPNTTLDDPDLDEQQPAEGAYQPSPPNTAPSERIAMVSPHSLGSTCCRSCSRAVLRPHPRGRRRHNSIPSKGLFF